MKNIPDDIQSTWDIYEDVLDNVDEQEQFDWLMENYEDSIREHILDDQYFRDLLISHYGRKG